ncbi:arylacetamide deacetylase-like 4 [Ctenodactylus gundi]
MMIWLETLLTAGCILGLGLSVWLVESCLSLDNLPAISQAVTLWLIQFSFRLLIALGNMLEKLKICSMPRLICFIQDRLFLKKNPQVMVTNLRFGTIPVRLFRPKAEASSPRRGVIFYHGGGGMFGSLDCYHNVCSFLSRKSDSVVLCVGYRKLPDYHYHVPAEDCLIATIHFLKTLTAYGVDPSRVVVCGDSAGGCVAALVTQVLVGRRDLPQIRAQVLIYTVIQNINFQLPSFQQNLNDPLFNKDLLMTFVCRYFAIDLSWQDALVEGSFIPTDFWNKYRKWLSSDDIPTRFKKKYQEPQFPGPFNEAAYLETKQLLDVEHIPLLAADEVIAQLPEAFLVSCEKDMVRDDTLLYKKRLEDQGVPVTWYHAEDGFHGCILLFDKKPFSFPCSQNIMNAVVSYIKGI